MEKSLAEVLVILQSLTTGFESKYFNLPTLENPYTENYIKILDQKYAYINVDMRGEKRIEIITDDLEEFIFRILEIKTFLTSVDYATTIHVYGKEQRAVAFKKHIEILKSFNVSNYWLCKLKRKYEEILNQKLFEE